MTLYSLQKNTRFVDRMEQKVTTNPKLGQKGHLKKQICNYLSIDDRLYYDYELCFDSVHCNHGPIYTGPCCNLMDGWWMHEMVIYVFQWNPRTI